ncbi:MAG: HD family phosphohydrolase [Silanimonas sp.]|nr:MAG: HD family phosphohydrolase [Silanimonas sp.]
MAEPTRALIELGQLRVGVFVQLDGHQDFPDLPARAFLIESEAQIERLRALGLARVWYLPERSHAPPLALPEADASWAALGVPVRQAPEALGDAVRGGDDGVQSVASTTPDAAAPEQGDAAGDGAHGVAPKDRRALLAAQQASLERCEQQYGEASRHMRSVLQNARANPQQARELAMAQVQAMVGQVAGLEDVAIRLLSEKAGQETTLHPMNVSVLSILLGRALKFDEARLRLLGLGAMLHDIGKLELPDRLRWRDDHAPAAERRLFQSHAQHGATIGRKMQLPDEVLEVIAQHHEFADGSGYPRGLKGGQISALARVVALVNQYDNLCNAGNPAQSLTPHDALALIFARQREAFDATVLAAFIRMMGVYPPGSVLQLNDGRYAIVVSVNSDRPLKPRILVHDPAITPEEALVHDLEEHPEIGIQRAIKPVQLPRAVFDWLSPRKRMCYFFERSLAAPRREPPA